MENTNMPQAVRLSHNMPQVMIDRSCGIVCNEFNSGHIKKINQSISMSSLHVQCLPISLTVTLPQNTDRHISMLSGAPPYYLEEENYLKMKTPSTHNFFICTKLRCKPCDKIHQSTASTTHTILTPWQLYKPR